MFPKHLDTRDRVSTSANPRHYLNIVLLFLEHFLLSRESRVSRLVDTFFHIMHHLAHDRAMTLDIYPDFTLLQCTTFTGLEIRACIIIVIILLYLGIRVGGPKPFYLVI